MKKQSCVILMAIVTLFFPITAFADAEINEWIGTYDMNHDGWVGTLSISDSKMDCATTKWCSLVLSYIDSKGVKHSGKIEKIDQKWQHMVFYINFPGNNQKFDAYLFSWDKAKIAGTTYWSGRTFGFYAVNKGRREAGNIQPGSPTSAGINLDRRILPDGTVETRSSDGTITQRSRSGMVKIFPDGRRQTILFQDVQHLTPPTPPPGTDTAKWLADHADRLLDIIVTLVPSDLSAKSNYLSSEGTTSSPYDRIRRRTDTINYLVSP